MIDTCYRPAPSRRTLQWIPHEAVMTAASDSFFAAFIAICLVFVGFMSGFGLALQMQPSEVECSFTVKDGTGNTHEWSKICKIR
jgi:hypothetical protein